MVIRTTAQRTDAGHTEDPAEVTTPFRTDRGQTLRECVRSTLGHYLENLDGHEVGDLYQTVMGEVEPPLIKSLLAYTRGNQTQSARLLGMSRGTLRKKMACYGIDQDP
ncbi:MAG: Fis family transcriptional regulator [Candidatus Thiosymbion ectosymbiont of Robbea hypermnestra]|nr:Fis family transcriptional regulator [Candidatus Thiosymbion ectosymbiont of Robbea hypermnestra]